MILVKLIMKVRLSISIVSDLHVADAVCLQLSLRAHERKRSNPKLRKTAQHVIATSLCFSQ